jgi:O-methyltransferase
VKRALKNFAALLMPATYRKLARLRAIARDYEWYHEEQHRREFLRRAFKTLKFNGISGDYAEFGTGGGMTFGLAYSEARKHGLNAKLWAFDSFAGLPARSGAADHHPMWQPGAMRVALDDFIANCDHNRISRDEYEIVAGYYEETLHEHADQTRLPNDIALAYIDCDLYSSTTTVLDFLTPRMKHGMIIAFDDYYCYSDRALAGERKACLEFLATTAKFDFAPYVQFGWHGMSFIVEDAELIPESGKPA